MSWLKLYAVVLNLILTFFAFIYVLYIISGRNESTYKTLWLLIILGLPITGTILYLCIGNKKAARPLKEKLNKAAQKAVNQPVYTEDMPENENQRLAQTFHYVEQKTGFLMLSCETAEYYPSGEAMWKQMLKDMETANNFILRNILLLKMEKCGTLWWRLWNAKW